MDSVKKKIKKSKESVVSSEVADQDTQRDNKNREASKKRETKVSKSPLTVQSLVPVPADQRLKQERSKRDASTTREKKEKKIQQFGKALIASEGDSSASDSEFAESLSVNIGHAKVEDDDETEDEDDEDDDKEDEEDDDDDDDEDEDDEDEEDDEMIKLFAQKIDTEPRDRENKYSSRSRRLLETTKEKLKIFQDKGLIAESAKLWLIRLLKTFKRTTPSLWSIREFQKKVEDIDELLDENQYLKEKLEGIEKELEVHRKYKETLETLDIKEQINELKKLHQNQSEKLDKIQATLLSSDSQGKNADEQRVDQVLIIDTPQGQKQTYCNILRKSLKKDKDLLPQDIIVTSKDRVIVKMKDKEDLEKVYKNLQRDKSISREAKVRLSKTPTQKVLLSGVPVDVTFDDILQAIHLVPGIQQGKLEIIKGFQGRTGLRHILVTTDNMNSEILVKRSRILIDMVSVRVSRFFEITRCFRCQRFGHISTHCRFAPRCACCGNSHDTRQCTSKIISCCNCPDPGSSHRADSQDCPVFQEKRREVLRRQQQD